ncbi:hypothetical protein FRB91_004041, partial [Serendipita sp. 411]
MSSPTLSAVAKISFLSSDVVLDVAGAKVHSAFSPLLSTFHAYRSPKLISVPNGADLGLRISKLDKGIPLITVVLHAERDTLNRLIPALSSLAGTPLVINVAVNGDLSDVLPLRASVDFLIHSATAQLAHDNALLAARLARTERVVVLHVFQTDGGGSFKDIDELKVKPFLAAPKSQATNGTHANGHGGLETLDSFTDSTVQEDARILQYNEAALATLALLQRPILPFHYQETGSVKSTLITLGPTIPPDAIPEKAAQVPHIPKHESAYTKVLDHVFGDRLEIINSPSLVATKGEVATRPEYALGRVEAHIAERSALQSAVESLLGASREIELSQSLHTLLAKWLEVRSDGARGGKIGQEIIKEIEAQAIDHPSAQTILSLRHQFNATSQWIIGSDAWSYDLGSSGLHHAIASGLNVNLLILDNTPYTTRSAADPEKRKKDVGLYAMNYGNSYVSSVAIYSSYGQVLRTLMEADKFEGPSIVLAYLPYTSEDDSALNILKETKLAVDSGYWPLYRWNPSKSTAAESFSLDSEAIKADLQEFLDRQNHISQLVTSEPKLAAELVTSLGSKLAEARSQKATAAYDAMLSGLDGPPLTILYASDGGMAEKYAKKLVTRAKLRGITSTIQSMDSFSLEDLKLEEHVVFITSTAGQGEPPQNGRETFKAFNAAAARGDKLFTTLKFSVFGLGDSHYWPRAEDAHYYNKPGKDLDKRLEQLGGERIADLGLGDDQDADGPMTGYKVWEPLLWKALGVDNVQVTEAEPEPVTNEHIKIASNFLRGTIAEGLKDTSTGALAPSDGQLTKFHGIYEQDDRDIRDERKSQGLEPAYSFMIRVRMAGGVCTPQQWLDMDSIADEHGNGTFKLTTRQTFQFHGVIKKHLKPSIQAINKALLDTIAACGDVNRNVLVASLPSLSHLHEECYRFGSTL